MPDLAPALSIPFAVLAILAAAGAWLDWRYRLLPNWLCAIVLAAGLGLVLARGGAPDVIPHLIHAAVALLVGMALFAGGLIGGGDAKFYAALAAWFPLSDGFRLLLLVGLAGMVLTIGLWATVWRRKADYPEDTGNVRTVPYGVAIGAGALFGTVL